MFCFFFVFSVILSIFSDETSLIVTENDPSTLVEGVSVITGDLYTYEEDYIVQGAEPITVHRSFLSREGYFKDHLYLTAFFKCDFNLFVVNEPNGTEVYYFPADKMKFLPVIGDHFFGDKKLLLVYMDMGKSKEGRFAHICFHP